MSVIDTRPADIANLQAQYQQVVFSDPALARRISRQLSAMQNSLGSDMRPIYELLRPWRFPS